MIPPQLNKKYFQKSKTFLYPLLGIKKYAPSPTQTYIAWMGRYTPKQRRLICLYTNDDWFEFAPFERGIIRANSLYFTSFDLNHKQKAFVFSFDKFRSDWIHFLNGRYSQFSNTAKLAIRHYFGETSEEFNIIKMYLFPDQFKELYAQSLFAPEDLNRGLRLLEGLPELCDKCNMSKETYRPPWSWQLPLFHHKDLF